MSDKDKLADILSNARVNFAYEDNKLVIIGRNVEFTFDGADNIDDIHGYGGGFCEECGDEL